MQVQAISLADIVASEGRRPVYSCAFSAQRNQDGLAVSCRMQSGASFSKHCIYCGFISRCQKTVQSQTEHIPEFWWGQALTMLQHVIVESSYKGLHFHFKSNHFNGNDHKVND